MTTDYDKIEAGRKLIEEGGGFAVVIWTADDLPAGMDDDARADWIEENSLVEYGNDYIGNMAP